MKFKMLFILVLFSFCTSAQKYCRSRLKLVIFDSSTSKRLNDVIISLKSSTKILGTNSNRKGIAKFRQIGLADTMLKINIYKFGYYGKREIPIAPNKKCVQKIYLKPWDTSMLNKIKEVL